MDMTPQGAFGKASPLPLLGIASYSFTSCSREYKIMSRYFASGDSTESAGNHLHAAPPPETNLLHRVSSIVLMVLCIWWCSQEVKQYCTCTRHWSASRPPCEHRKLLWSPPAVATLKEVSVLIRYLQRPELGGHKIAHKDMLTEWRIAKHYFCSLQHGRQAH